MEEDEKQPLIDFGVTEDKSKDIIKVIGVGGGGCNAVNNMYHEGIVNVTFAVCNTDSQSLTKSPVPVKIQLGAGLGAGGDPKKGREAAENNIEDIKRLLDDGTKMVFVTAGMGGGTGTGAAPIVAGVAKSMGILTTGIVTIPFYFEKKKKIIKALKGVEEMRKNVDALLIINNERICDIYSDSEVTVKESFRRADQILSNATKSISELITVEGDINLDFCDVETTLRNGGGAIMAIGRAKGEHRVEKALIDALDSPLLYGNDIGKAKRILFNIYTSEKYPLFVKEMNEVDTFMDALDPNIEVIWGVSDDNTLDEDAKVTILATGFEEELTDHGQYERNNDEEDYYENFIRKLYKPYRRVCALDAITDTMTPPSHDENIVNDIPAPAEETREEESAENTDDIPFTISVGGEDEENVTDGNQEENGTETDNHAGTSQTDAATDVSIETSIDADREAETVSTEPSQINKDNDAPYERTAPGLEFVDDEEDRTVATDGKAEKKHHPLRFVDRAKKLLDEITKLTQD